MTENGDGSKRLPAAPHPDIDVLMQALNDHGPDAEYTVVKRDGRIVNVSVEINLRKQIEKRRLQEPVR